MKKIFAKWWFYLTLIFILLIVWFILSESGVVPGFVCGSTMGPDWPVSWCVWHQGTGILVG